MHFDDFVQWAFYGLISGALIYGVSVLQSLKQSIDNLNTSVAQIIEKTSWHEKILDRLDERVTSLEGEK